MFTPLARAKPNKPPTPTAVFTLRAPLPARGPSNPRGLGPAAVREENRATFWGAVLLPVSQDFLERTFKELSVPSYMTESSTASWKSLSGSQ